MNKNTIFFDIDGTIFSHQLMQIPNNTKLAIKQAQANGHLAFINTGRTRAELNTEILQFGFDGYICGCGTYISLNDTVLLQRTIPSDQLQNLIIDLRSHNIEAVLEGKTAIYYDDDHATHPMLNNFKEQHIRYKLSIKSWENPDISVDKLCIWPKSKNDYDFFYLKYKNNFEFINRGNGFYEVVPIGYSKATGITYLLNHLNLSHENTYAMGDSSNDLSMLNYVTHSIAMENSSKEVLDRVSFITKDVDHDGIAHALKHFNLI